MEEKDIDGTIQTNLKRHMVPMNIGYTAPLSTLNKENTENKGKTIRFVKEEVSEKKA